MVIVSEKYSVVIYKQDGEVHYIIYDINELQDLLKQHEGYTGVKVLKKGDNNVKYK